MAQVTSKTTNIPQKYSFKQLEDLWVKAGGSKAVAPIMAAIAIAESGGRPKAVSGRNKNGTVDRGLWQINSVHGYGTSSLDPVANAKQAVGVYHSQGLNAWTTFKTGAYLKPLRDNTGLSAQDAKTLKDHAGFISKAKITTTGGLGGSGVGTGITGGGGLINQATGPVESAIMLGLKEAMYALAILGGGMLVLLGLLLIGVDLGLSSMAQNHPVVKAAKRATPTRSKSSGGETKMESGENNLPGPE